MAKQSSKAAHDKIVVHSPEMLNYADYAVNHLWDMVSVLKYHTHAQRDAVGTENQPSAKESQALAKTMLSLYKQIDRYMEILHPAAIMESTQGETEAELSPVEQSQEQQRSDFDPENASKDDNDKSRHLKQEASVSGKSHTGTQQPHPTNPSATQPVETAGLPTKSEPDFKGRKFA